MSDFILPILVVLVWVSMSARASENKKRQQEASLAKAKARAAQGRAADDASETSALKPMERRPLQPTLHDHSGMFDGSMHADNGAEGYDPDSLTMPSALSEDAINASLTGQPAQRTNRPPILPEFTGGNLARAFVFQEILKRPGQRR